MKNADVMLSYISAVLHQMAQVLMIPVMIVLVGLVGYAIYCLGSLVAEAVTERRYYKLDMPKAINLVHDAAYGEIALVLRGAALLRPQRRALQTIVANMGLSEDDLFALAKSEIARVDDRYKRIVQRSDQVTKIAPMLGLMCTLIPLGPGIVAMGAGDVNQLSMSLLIAFDGTVAGLVAAVIAMLASGIRKRWYNQYLIALENLMTCLLDKAAVARREGVVLPHGVFVAETAAAAAETAPEAASAAAESAAAAPNASAPEPEAALVTEEASSDAA